VNNNLDEDQTPILVVYSFEREKESADYNLTTEILLQQLKDFDKNLTDNVRRKRSSSMNIACTLFDLEIPTRNIPLNFIGSYTTFKAVYPKSFNAKICGGFCANNNVHDEAKHHPLLINILRNADELSRYNFGQSCAPIAYEPLYIYGVADYQVPMVRDISNMVVTKCGCLDIAV